MLYGFVQNNSINTNLVSYKSLIKAKRTWLFNNRFWILNWLQEYFKSEDMSDAASGGTRSIRFRMVNRNTVIPEQVSLCDSFNCCCLSVCFLIIVSFLNAWLFDFYLSPCCFCDAGIKTVLVVHSPETKPMSMSCWRSSRTSLRPSSPALPWSTLWIVPWQMRSMKLNQLVLLCSESSGNVSFSSFLSMFL